MQFGYLSKLEADTRLWVEQGIIDSSTASTMLDDVKSRKSGYSFSSIVIVLGVICLCFAAMTFVAANWEEMPKIMRVLLLLAAMWAAYGASVYADNRGYRIISDACVLLGCGIFGAAIMLIGQMYHLQGKASDAVLLWAGGSTIAALVLRSTGALWLAIALFTFWLVMSIEPLFGTNRAVINIFYPVFWLVCAALAYWLRSPRSAHLLAIGLIIWIAITVAILSDRHQTLSYGVALYGALYVGIALTLLSLENRQYLRGFEASIIGYLAICIIVLTAGWIGVVSFNENDKEILQAIDNLSFIPIAIMLILALGILGLAWTKKSRQIYDLVFCAIWIAAAMILTSSFGLRVPFLSEAFALGIAIWLIRMGGRQDIHSITRLGYTAFALVMLLIYFRTAGSLLGTSGFYLTAGMLMVLGAIFLPKFFRSRNKTPEVTQ